MVRNVLDLDRRTHRFLIEPLLGHLHLKTMLLSRLVTFHKGLINSPKFTIRFLARITERDLRTAHGKSLHLLMEQCNVDRLEDLNSNMVKRKVVYYPRLEDHAWRTSLAFELFRVRKNDVTIEGFSDTETNDIFNYICTE